MLVWEWLRQNAGYVALVAAIALLYFAKAKSDDDMDGVL